MVIKMNLTKTMKKNKTYLICGFFIVIIVLGLLFVAPMIVSPSSPIADFDGDGVINLLDPDDDNDGILDGDDVLPYDPDNGGDDDTSQTPVGPIYILTLHFTPYNPALPPDTVGNPVEATWDHPWTTLEMNSENPWGEDILWQLTVFK